MSDRQSPQVVLSTVPGWESASFRELSGGFTNRTFLVESGQQKAVLKIDDAPRSEPFNERRKEAQVQTVAARKGLAATVLFVSETAYMTEYMEGRIWSNTCLEDNANLDLLSAALRQLHALPLTGRTFDAMGAAREYVRRIPGADQDKVNNCLKTIEAAPRPPNLCCCHNDLVAANIINTPDVCFLDWEYACDNDPFFDLATVVAHHKLTTEQSDYLLDAYFDGDGKRWREQLERQAGVYDALHWLWETSRLPAVAQLP